MENFLIAYSIGSVTFLMVALLLVIFSKNAQYSVRNYTSLQVLLNLFILSILWPMSVSIAIFTYIDRKRGIK